MQTGIISAVDYTNSIIQVAIDQTGSVGWFDIPSSGNNTSGIQMGASVGDRVYLDEVTGYIIVVQAVADQNHKQTLLEDQILIFNKSGIQIFLDPTGNVRIIPGIDPITGIPGVIQIGSLNLKKVARDGDSVTGTDSHGDTFTGTIQASSSSLEAS